MLCVRFAWRDALRGWLFLTEKDKILAVSEHRILTNIYDLLFCLTANEQHFFLPHREDKTHATPLYRTIGN